MKQKSILLTFDLEEFDLPLEYNQPLTKQKQFEISKQGLIPLLELLKHHQTKATFFTTAEFAKKFPAMINEIKNQEHEIACHGFTHSNNSIKQIENARQELERITRKKIKGYRAPRFGITNNEVAQLQKIGFVYDSSINPTWLPGRYCNLFKKRNIHNIDKTIEIPPSTLPLIPFLRAPLFWLTFKNFPLTYSKLFTKINSLFTDYTMLIFHPWEFANLEKFQIPFYTKSISGKNMLKKLHKYILFCKGKGFEFKSVEWFLRV